MRLVDWHIWKGLTTITGSVLYTWIIGLLLVYFFQFVVALQHSNYTFLQLQIAFTVRNFIIFLKVFCFQDSFHKL